MAASLTQDVQAVPAPPAPPAAPSPEAARVDAAIAKAREAVAQIGGDAATSAQAGGVSIVRNAQGQLVVTGRDGRQTIIDVEGTHLNPNQVQDIIMTAMAPAPPPAQSRPNGPPEGIIAFLVLSVICATIVLLTWMRQRARHAELQLQTRGAGGGPDANARLERIEQAVEAIAIEVERVSEAQRFSARLLSERLPEALPRLDAAARAERGA